MNDLPASTSSSSLLDDLKAGSASLIDYFGQIGHPTLRLGVTGLSRAGKTVFITGLVHALIAKAPLPGLRVQADGRLIRVRLGDQPDDAVPRFAYEDHLASLTAPDRQWPHSTRQIAQLRLEIAYQSRRTALGGLLGPGGLIGSSAQSLTLDLVDYPGEWLLDLALLGKTYRQWADETLAKAKIGTRAGPFAPYLAALTQIVPESEADEGEIKALAQVFTQALRACREEGRALSALPPGRFLMPGDLEGAPALTFAPLPAPQQACPQGSFDAVMERRFEAYKAKIVRPFFKDHFSRLDRQIVLVDVLGAINGGVEALNDLEEALTDVLLAFRVGENTLLSTLFSPKIDKLLFVATKADHLHQTSHAKLTAILQMLVRRAIHRARGSGAQIDVQAIAAIRATREVLIKKKSEELACIAGVPIAGETLDSLTFDGETETALFPGDLPATPEALFQGEQVPLQFLRFRPPISRTKAAHLPSIRLDTALEFLIGDRLV